MKAKFKIKKKIQNKETEKSIRFQIWIQNRILNKVKYPDTQ